MNLDCIILKFMEELSVKKIYRILLLALIAITILVTLTMSPVAAAEDRDTKGGRSIDADRHGDDDSLVPREGYDERFRCGCHAPDSFSQVPNLQIDPALITATPHWIFLAAGEKEQEALLKFLNNADIPPKKRAEWKRFMTRMWKKYPVRYVKTRSSARLELGDHRQSYSLTAEEKATFQEIETYIAQEMEKTQQETILPMWAPQSHSNFAVNAFQLEEPALKDDQYYRDIIDQGAQAPDGFYENDPIPFDHQLNHGFVPAGLVLLPYPLIVLPPQILGLGFAPDNYGKYAALAKQEYSSRDYADAFKDMAYASHFISDLGNPYHTPMAQIIPLQFVDSPISLIVFPNSGMIVDYELLHNNYEHYADVNFASFGTTTASYIPVDPTYSAKGHAVFSWALSYPLIYSCYWHYLLNNDFNFGSDPQIVWITQNRVTETAKHNNGLVQFVTGGKPVTFTITPGAGPGGSIFPSDPVTINYGQSQTFTIQPAPNFAIDDVKINGVSQKAISRYTFDINTLNKAKGEQTISATFKSTAPPPSSGTEWIWSRDGWGDWQHTASWSGTQVGPNSEYGPVMVNGHGEHGTDTNLLAGSTQASVWRTFTDPSGTGWNTLTFDGLLSACDVPAGRWMTIEVNGQQVFAATELNTPPGNGQPFEIRATFPQAKTVTVKITDGQSPAWGPRFFMEYDSLRLSQGTGAVSLMRSLSVPQEIPPTGIIVANMTETTAPAETIVATDTTETVEPTETSVPAEPVEPAGTETPVSGQ